MRFVRRDEFGEAKLEGEAYGFLFRALEMAYDLGVAHGEKRPIVSDEVANRLGSDRIGWRDLVDVIHDSANAK